MTIREALYALLKADATLKELAPGGVWFESADREEVAQQDPVVIFSMPTGAPQYTFGDSTDFQEWDIQGVGPIKKAEAIDARCRALLFDAELTIVGRETLYLRPTQDINYREQTDGETYQHVGATYSITTERTS